MVLKKNLGICLHRCSAAKNADTGSPFQQMHLPDGVQARCAVVAGHSGTGLFLCLSSGAQFRDLALERWKLEVRIYLGVVLALQSSTNVVEVCTVARLGQFECSLNYGAVCHPP